MTEKSKSWISNNVMGIIIAVMFTAFWVQYESNRRSDQLEKKETTKDQIRQNNQLISITMVLLSDPDTDDESKVVLREFLKLETRGVIN
jgi:hypothetical protein